jgi:hypothetical protein
MSQPISQPMSLTNSRRSLKTLTTPENAFFDKKGTYVWPKLGQNQGLWCHFGDMPCQGNVTYCRPKNQGRLRSYVTYLHSLLAAVLLATRWLFLACSRIRKVG